MVLSGRTRVNVQKLKYRKFHLDLRKELLVLRVIKNWKRLSREGLKSPTLQILKILLDMVLDHLVCASLLEQQSWTKWCPELPSTSAVL